jgi:hypothetical protein
VSAPALWTNNAEAQALLATFATNPPVAIHIDRPRLHGAEMEFAGWVYIGKRVDALTAIYSAAFKVIDSVRPWDREACLEFLKQPGVQEAVTAAVDARGQQVAA